MMDCLLCLEPIKNVEGGLRVESTQWHKFNVMDLIDSLWSIDTLSSQSWLCSTCWKELYSFQPFYVRIKELHDGLSSLLITESDPLEEERNPKDFSLENLLEPEIVVDQSLDMAIIIKDENEEPHKNNFGDNANEKSLEAQCDAHEHIDDDGGDCNKDSDSSDSDDGLPLVRRRSTTKSSAKILTKQNRRLKNKSDATKSDAVIDKSNTPPKLHRIEYDKFLQKNFKITCNNCPLTFEKFRDLCKHYGSEHNERGFVVCCQMKFFNRRLLVDHINYHLNPQCFKCEHCSKVFPKRRCLVFHLKSHKELKHCCDVCDRKFVEKTRLERHKLTHLSEKEKKFPCNECTKFFANENVLNLHIRVTHLNIYAKVCEICGQTISDSNTFRRHMEKHDTTKPPSTVKCDECGLMLSGKQTLRRHKDYKHTVGEKRNYTCGICMKVSPNLNALKKHIRCTHEKGYIYKCTMCEKAFKRSENLKAHMSTHTGAPLYRCPWCPKEFNSNGNMHNHRKKSHPIEWKDARRKKYSGNLPPDYKLPTTKNSQYVSSTFDIS